MNNKSTDELAKILWEYNNLHQSVEKSDVIITLGSHDTRVAERGAELYLQEYAPLIVFSGGFGRLTAKEWTRPEADIFAEIAVKMGVPEKDIIRENKSTNTGENIAFTMKLLQEKDIKPERVLLVHKPYMERRAFAIWEKQFPDITVRISSPQIPYETYSEDTGIPKEYMINIIVGDTQRIKYYPEKGFMTTQYIPADVWAAYEELVKRGYTSQLINNPI